MSRLYVARGEDRRLDEEARRTVEGSFLELSDGITHYCLAGPPEGPLVVLVPGLTIPLGYWDPVAAPLRTRGFRTLAYSAYGRGWSDRVEGRYDPELFVRQLAELLNVLAPGQRIHLVGTSLGGLVAMAYATEAPGRLPLSMALIGPAGMAPKRPPLTGLLRHDAIARLLGSRLGARILDKHTANNVRRPQDAQRLRQLLREPARFHGTTYAVLSTLRDFPLTGRHDLYRRAGDLPVPKLLIWGRHDHVTPIGQLPTVRDLYRPSSSHILDHCGHMVPFEDAPTTVRLLLPFLSNRTGELPA
ncbi:alpha/beta hydrolase [Streptomyces sp. GMY02]|uniref:alpha/beta fold hydrolase n=1 Tax=Streptomyces sp. GMY02 TaxID=1333528 RepID=UPI001C2BB5A5|nr:alpha/beta hydrolase [Streptomyces sp. GMY02]QXE38270.1 alpha/beta hydrolase [Streptomyces sp. GMY02]